MEHEMIDKYNKIGEKIGVIDKAIAHRDGILHKAVHVWILNNKNEILLQYRCPEKTLYPDIWDTSFAGHIGAGESSIEAVIREGKEELGIDVDLDKLNFVATIREHTKFKDINSNEFVDVFILKQNVDINEMSYQKEEVSTAKYVSLDEFWNLIKTDKIVPHETVYMLLKEIIEEYKTLGE